MGASMLRGFGVASFGLAVILGSATPGAAQQISLAEINRPRPASPLAVPITEDSPTAGAMLASCSGHFSQHSPEEIARRKAEFEALFRDAPRATSPVKHSFLLEPPFACTPNVDRLFSRLLDDLTSLSFAEFLSITKLPELDRSARVGTYEERKKFDLRAATIPTRFAAIQRLIADKRLEQAHTATHELFPGKRGAVSLVLATFFLSAVDEDLQRFGRKCLEQAFEQTDPERAIEFRLLCMRLALKEHRWADAMLHSEEVASALQPLQASLHSEALNRFYMETYVARFVVCEQRGSYSRGLTEIEAALSLNERDPTLLLHKGALIFLRDPSNPSARQEAMKFLEYGYDASLRPVQKSAAAMPAIPPPDLLFLELRAEIERSASERAELVKSWREFLDKPAPWQQEPAEKLNVYLIAARRHADLDRWEDAERLMSEAEQIDPHAAQSSPLRTDLLYYLSDSRAAAVLGEKFLSDPSNEKIARMLTLTLLDSADVVERYRGRKLAELLHRAHPKSDTFTIAAAYSEYVFQRESAAYELIKPIVEGKGDVSFDDAYLMARILARADGTLLIGGVDRAKRIVAKLTETTGPARYRKQAEMFHRGLAGLR